MNPFFTIITPSLQRESLGTTCVTVDCQTFADWQHIIMVDCEEFNWELLDGMRDPRRGFAKCEKPHKNGGNTCRHNAWTLAKGNYVLYLDDDNYLADTETLQRIHDVLQSDNLPQVAFFPIFRLGGRFFPEGKPRLCHVDTSNLVVAREIGQWPETDAYCSDGIFIEDLVSKYPYSMFGHVAPIVVMPKISFGK